MIAIRVRAALPGYRAAVAELAHSAVHASPSGLDVEVVGGGPGWCDSVRRAAVRARAVIVSEPSWADPSDVQALVGEVGDVIVAVERRRLRPDALEGVHGRRAGGGDSLRTAACGGPEERLVEIVRDAVGWLRMLGGDLEVRSPGPHQALLMAADGVPATLIAAATASPWLRVRALGETVLSITVAETPGGRTDTSATLADERGILLAPPRYETSERLMLRRTAAALERGDRLDDLRDLAHDASRAASALESFAHRRRA